jgi:hypothetical protein
MTMYCAILGESDFGRKLVTQRQCVWIFFFFKLNCRYETACCEQNVMVVLHVELVIDILQFWDIKSLCRAMTAPSV